MKDTHTFKVFEVALQVLLGLLGVGEVLRREERAALECSSSPRRLAAWWAVTHRFTLLLQVLQILCEVHAHGGHHVLSDELPLARVVIELVQDLLERSVVAESAAQDGRVGMIPWLVGIRVNNNISIVLVPMPLWAIGGNTISIRYL